MAFVFESVFIDILLGVTLVIIIHYWLAFKYWKKRKVPQVSAPTFPFGDMGSVVSKKNYIGIMCKNLYDKAKALGHKHFGILACSTPIYLPIALDYVKNILQRDFNYFTERGFYYNEKDDPLSANLFAIGGAKWRTLRTKLSPAYTSGKLRSMFDGVVQCSYQMQDAIEKVCVDKRTVNIKTISECFTVDVIGSCAFGLECNSFKHPEAEFIKQGRKIFHFTMFRLIKVFFAFANPKIGRWIGITLFDSDLTGFFINVVRDSLRHRKTDNFIRKDFLQLLLDLKDEDTNKQESKSNFSLEEITAQVFIFFAAGFETSSITLTFALYEVATNSEIQNKLRQEINQVLAKHKGEITYEAIMDMKFLNQVVEGEFEHALGTLRKYPPVAFITRVAVKDYKIPGTETIIEKGMQAVISILGLHRDAEYYPDPDRFDPERFSDENKQRRLPFTYMPFGEGPRICIGLRFGLMQVKVGLVALLKDFKFSVDGKTQVPLEMDPYSFTLTPMNGIFLNIDRGC